MNLTNKKIIASALLIFSAFMLFAQDRGDVPEPNRMPPPPPGLPIDNSVIVLLVLGLMLGVMVHLRSKRLP